jgi:hypothetical protein
MIMVLRVVLDTGALIALSGLKGTDLLEDFVGRCTKSGAVLCVTHVQVDEKVAREVHDYKTKVDRAVAELRELGLSVKIEATEIFVWGVSRFGLGKFSGEDEGRLYDKLRELVSDCDRKKGKSVDDLNVARDATIAVSALDHDAFIVCDDCLFSSFQSATIGMRQLEKRVPKVVYSKPDPVDVGEAILELIRQQSREDYGQLLEVYNGAAQFNAISLVAVVFGQFSILAIVPTVRALWIAVPVLLAVYFMILFAGSYFLSQYFVFARGIWRIREHRGMGMNYHMLEETLEAETQECVSGWYRRVFRRRLIETKNPNDLLLHGIYWVISVILFVIVYLA